MGLKCFLGVNIFLRFIYILYLSSIESSMEGLVAPASPSFMCYCAQGQYIKGTACLECVCNCYWICYTSVN